MKRWSTQALHQDSTSGEALAPSEASLPIRTRWAQLVLLCLGAVVGALLVASFWSTTHVVEGLAIGALVLWLGFGAVLVFAVLPASRMLRQTSRRLHTLFHAAPWGMYLYDLEPDGRLVLVGANPSADRIIGIDHRPLLGKTLEEAFPALARTDIVERYRAAAAFGTPWRVDAFPYSQGAIRGTFEVHAFQTSPGQMAVTFIDATERERAAEQIRRERDFGNLLIDTMPGPFFLLDEALALRRWNAAVEGLHPGGAAALEGLAVVELLVDGDRDAFARACRRALGGERVLVEAHFRTPNGAVPFHTTMVRLGGGQRQLVGAGLDLSSLRRAEQQRDSLFNHSLDMLCVADFQGHFKQLNPAWARLGWSEQELCARPWLDFVHPDDRERTRAIAERLAVGEPVQGFENRYLAKAGGYRWLSWNSFPLREEGLILAVVRDVTEEKRDQEELERHRHHLEALVREKTAELEQAQRELMVRDRLATLGRLTATVSHELRNPLGVVRTSLFTLNRRLGGTDPAIDRALQRADRHIVRCDEIVEELLSLTRPPEARLERVDLGRWLAQEFVGFPVEPGIEVETSLPGNVEAVADRELLRRAVRNVVANALEAMGSLPTERPRRLGLSVGRTPERVEICVRDTGPGMAEEVRSRAFEPLFSTRKFGVGLGLPIAKQILEQHGGGVEVDSERGRGTTVTLWLPVREVQAHAPAAHPGGG